MNIAIKIRDARRKANLSQDELGEVVGVSDKSISAYELSRSTPPLSKLKKIAIATNHPLSYFTGEETTKSSIMTKLLSIEKQFIDIKKILFKE